MSGYPPAFNSPNYVNQYRNNNPNPQYGNNPQNGFLQPPQQNMQPSSPGVVDEITLFETSEEREKFENLADLYAIAMVTGRLEKLFIRSSVDGYEDVCNEFISKYKTYEEHNQLNPEKFTAFCREYTIPEGISKAALRRLTAQVPATVKYKPPSSNKKENINAKVLEATTNFITASNSLTMDMVDVDEIRPYVRDVVDSLNQLTNLNFKGRDLMMKWLSDLTRRSASDRLSEDEKRQLQMDLELAFEMFKKALGER